MRIKLEFGIIKAVLQQRPVSAIGSHLQVTRKTYLVARLGDLLFEI